MIHLEQFFAEIEHNIECDVKGGATNMTGWESRLLVSDRAHVVLDLHQTIDGLLEKEKGKSKIGTTNRGIGPVYSAKMARIGFRVCELYDEPEVFEAKFKTNVANYQKRHADLEVVRALPALPALPAVHTCATHPTCLPLGAIRSHGRVQLTRFKALL